MVEAKSTSPTDDFAAAIDMVDPGGCATCAQELPLSLLLKRPKPTTYAKKVFGCVALAAKPWMSVPGSAGLTDDQVWPPSSERRNTSWPAAYAVFEFGGSATPIASLPPAPESGVQVAPPSWLTSMPWWCPNVMVRSSV